MTVCLLHNLTKNVLSFMNLVNRFGGKIPLDTPCPSIIVQAKEWWTTYVVGVIGYFSCSPISFK